MSRSSKATTRAGVNDVTQPEMTIAERLRSNIKLYRSTPYRGQSITLYEAHRRTGIEPAELMRRVESGELEAAHYLLVDSADFEDETIAYQRREFARIIEEATGTAPTDETMVGMFGPRYASKAESS